MTPTSTAQIPNTQPFVQGLTRLARELEEVIAREGADTIAGFFAEPVMGAGGVIPPAAGYFQAVQPILERHGIPLISDEVICGFGRTGSTWGCETSLPASNSSIAFTK